MTGLLMLKNGMLLALALAASFFRRSAAGMVPRCIAVVQGAKMGDMVCTTPLFRALKERYPESRLIVIGNELNGELLAGHPHVDRYHTRPEGFFPMARLLREEGVDAGLLCGLDPEVLLALLYTRVPVIVAPRLENGWSPYETKTYRLASRLVSLVPHRMGSYAPREYLRLLEPLGILTEDTRKELAVSAAAEVSVKEKLLRLGAKDGELLIGIAPSAGNKIKLWGGKRFAEVARALGARANVRIIIIDGKESDPEVEAMRRALPPELPVADLSGKLSVEELKALIRKLALFVSVDTGPIYIAESFGVPTVDIVGPMSEDEQPPRGEKHSVVVPPRDKPAIHIMNAAVYDVAEARRQATAASSEEVIRAAEGLLESRRA